MATALRESVPWCVPRCPPAAADRLFSALPPEAHLSARLPAACATPLSTESLPAHRADNAARRESRFSWAVECAQAPSRSRGRNRRIPHAVQDTLLQE